MGVIDRLDPENLAALRSMPPRDVRDIPAVRRSFDEAVAAAGPVRSEAVEQADHEVPRLDGDGTLVVRVYRPQALAEPLPCLLWMHGGGYVYGSIDAEDGWIQALVADVGCAVASVDYRLAPEHPYPAGLDDCLAALRWLRDSAAELELDPRRLAVGGASAGAGLAAALALRCRDEGGWDDLRLQLLVYPMLDDRHVTHSSHAIADPLLWSIDQNLIAWRAYLGREPGADDVPATAAPSRADDLSGLAPTFLAVADVDLLVDESVDYAQRLMRAGVRTELIVYPGSHHGVLRVPADSRAGLRMNADLRRALREALEG